MTVPKTRRRFRILIVLLVIIATGAILYRPLLAAVHDVLISHDAIGPVDTVVFVGGGSAWYDEIAAKIESEQVRRILIIEPRQYRAVQVGATRSLSAGLREELTAQGIDPETITVMETDAMTTYGQLSHLQSYLSQRQGVVAILCSDIQTRYFRTVINDVLQPGEAERVQIWGVEEGACTPNSWWRNSTGLKKLAFSSLRLTYVCLWGEGSAASQQSHI